MSRITFQFVPSSLGKAGQLSLEAGADCVREIAHSPTGVTVAELQDGQVEFDSAGLIRYSVETDTIERDVIEEVFDSARDVLEKVLQKEERSYRVSLVIGEMESFNQYFDNRMEIWDFGLSRLDSQDPNYTELDDHSVKISFSSDGKRVTV